MTKKKYTFRMPEGVEELVREESGTEKAKVARYEERYGKPKPETTPELAAALRELSSKKP